MRLALNHLIRFRNGCAIAGNLSIRSLSVLIIKLHADDLNVNLINSHINQSSDRNQYYRREFTYRPYGDLIACHLGSNKHHRRQHYGLPVELQRS